MIVTDTQALRVPAQPALLDAGTPGLLTDMTLAMHRAGGCGIAAPQIGEPVRACIVLDGTRDIAMLNPRIVQRKGTMQPGTEGCLSLPGQKHRVRRHSTVVVEYQDVDGSPRRMVARGWLARTVQHELDHLDGVLIADRSAF